MIWKFLSAAIKPVANLIDELHTSEDERNQVKSALFAMQNEMACKVMDYEKQLLESKAKIITAEATGASWLQRNWRPITMLTFLALVVLDTFGLTAWLSMTLLDLQGIEKPTHWRLADEAWTLLQIGLGGYVVGRSAEKIIPKVTEVMGKK